MCSSDLRVKVPLRMPRMVEPRRSDVRFWASAWLLPAGRVPSIATSSPPNRNAGGRSPTPPGQVRVAAVSAAWWGGALRRVGVRVQRAPSGLSTGLPSRFRGTAAKSSCTASFGNLLPPMRQRAWTHVL